MIDNNLVAWFCQEFCQIARDHIEGSGNDTVDPEDMYADLFWTVREFLQEVDLAYANLLVKENQRNRKPRLQVKGRLWNRMYHREHSYLRKGGKK